MLYFLYIFIFKRNICCLIKKQNQKTNVVNNLKLSKFCLNSIRNVSALNKIEININFYRTVNIEIKKEREKKQLKKNNNLEKGTCSQLKIMITRPVIIQEIEEKIFSAYSGVSSIILN